MHTNSMINSNHHNNITITSTVAVVVAVAFIDEVTKSPQQYF